MKREDTVRIDTHFLTRRIEVLDLKQGWVARQVGVDRKTVSRWVTGKVKRMARASAEALASVLDCELGELTVSDEADVLATKAEQRVAAQLIQQRDLLQLLSPSDDWQLAESLIRATLQPDLPKAQLGQLYNLLSIAAWRQGHYAEGRQRAERALELAGELGDKAIAHKARANLATIASLTGSQVDALAAYERCLREPEYFATKRDHGAALSNVADVYRCLGRFADSVAAQEHSIRLFGEQGLDFNLAISFVSLGYVHTEQGNYEQALEAYTQGGEHARRANYARGVDCDPLYRADARSLLGETAAAADAVAAALPALAKHDVYDLGCHECAARVLRRAGRLDAATATLAEGLARSTPFPVIHAFMRCEEVRLRRAEGDAAGEQAALEAAHAAFRATGLEVRVGPVPPEPGESIRSGSSPDASSRGASPRPPRPRT